MSEVIEKAKKAKVAKEELVHQPTERKNEALSFIAEAIRFKQDEILAENEKDIVRGKEKGFSPALLDRLALTPERLNDIADAVMLLTKLEDPVGETLETIRKDNGLFIENVRVPLGVVGMIYEARPNVTVDAATLCLKTGNAVILRGSSSAINSNKALVRVIREALERSALPEDAVQLIEDTSKETAKQLFHFKRRLGCAHPERREKTSSIWWCGNPQCLCLKQARGTATYSLMNRLSQTWLSRL